MMSFNEDGPAFAGPFEIQELSPPDRVDNENVGAAIGRCNTEAGGKPAPKHMTSPHIPIKIHIDKKLFDAPKATMTGGELRALGGVKSDRDLFEKIPSKDDLFIKNDDSVELKNGDQFYSAPSSLNPGSHAS